jgi:hypothetical protein
MQADATLTECLYVTAFHVFTTAFCSVVAGRMNPCFIFDGLTTGSTPARGANIRKVPALDVPSPADSTADSQEAACSIPPSDCSTGENGQ